MERIVTYLDIPDAEKDSILEQPPHIGFCPVHGKQRAMKEEMEKSQKGRLPQYIFVFRENSLIGYMFLIAEKAHYSESFPWWAVDNSDELPLKTAIQLLEYGIQLSLEGDCPNLAERLKCHLENQKKGIGRRPENACR